MRDISSGDVSNKRKQRDNDTLSILVAKWLKRPATQLRLGSLTLPLNDKQKYREALEERQFYSVLPSDRSGMETAVKYNLTSRVVFGVYTEAVEGILLDEETVVPWQICKVTMEYKPVDYTGRYQPYTQSLDAESQLLLSPKTEVKRSV